MTRRKRLATAGVITATVALAGTSPALAVPIPPKAFTVPGAMAAPAPEPAPAVPTFANGMSQNVFSANSADWITLNSCAIFLRSVLMNRQPTQLQTCCSSLRTIFGEIFNKT